MINSRSRPLKIRVRVRRSGPPTARAHCTRPGAVDRSPISTSPPAAVRGRRVHGCCVRDCRVRGRRVRGQIQVKEQDFFWDDTFLSQTVEIPFETTDRVIELLSRVSQEPLTGSEPDASAAAYTDTFPNGSWVARTSASTSRSASSFQSALIGRPPRAKQHRRARSSHGHWLHACASCDLCALLNSASCRD